MINPSKPKKKSDEYFHIYCGLNALGDIGPAFGRAGGGREDLPAAGPQMEEFKMSKFVTRFLKDESGATAIEYGLIAALVAVAIASVLPLLGNKLSNTFNGIQQKLP